MIFLRRSLVAILALSLPLAAAAQSTPGSLGRERILEAPEYKLLRPEQLAPALQAEPPRGTELPTRNAPPELPLTLFNLRAMYQFSWNGIPLGEVFLDSAEGNGMYRMRVDIHASGVASVFNALQSRTSVVGSFVLGEAYYPKTYETVYVSRKKTKYIRMEYGEKRQFKAQYNNPPKRARAEDFSDEMKHGAYDPLSAAFEIRRGLYQALKEGKRTFKIPMYDGRRLADLYFVIKRETTVSSIPAWEVRAERYPIAGYSEEELQEMVGEPQMAIFFSRDALLIPLAMSVSAYLGTIEGKFVKECATVESCMGDDVTPLTMPQQDVPPNP